MAPDGDLVVEVGGAVGAVVPGVATLPNLSPGIGLPTPEPVNGVGTGRLPRTGADSFEP